MFFCHINQKIHKAQPHNSVCNDIFGTFELLRCHRAKRCELDKKLQLKICINPTCLSFITPLEHEGLKKIVSSKWKILTNPKDNGT